MKKIKGPNFFSVGQDKAGTSALFGMLKQHPEIFIPERREPSYFAKDVEKEEEKAGIKRSHFFFKDWEDYIALFKTAKNEKAIGDMSNSYLRSKEAPKLIHKYKPSSRIIIILREPVDWLISVYHQLQRSEETHYNSFVEALSKNKKTELIKKRFPRSYMGDYLEKTDYASYLENYTKTFPKKQIKIILYDDFKSDPRKILKEIFEFLGVDDSFVPEILRANVSKSVKNMALKKISDIDFIVGLRQFSKRHIPEKIWSKISQTYEKIIYKKGKESVPEEFKSKLRQEITPNVIRLSKFFKKNKLSEKDPREIWRY